MKNLAILVLGLMTISVGAIQPSGAQSARGAQSGSVFVAVGDDWFCEPSFQNGYCDTTIFVGQSVTWDYVEGVTFHTSTECGDSCDLPTSFPVWDSGFMSAADKFTWTFDMPGTFLYYCTLHPFSMRGRIIVIEPAPTPMPTIKPGGPGTIQPGDAGENTPAAIPPTGAAPSRRNDYPNLQSIILLGSGFLATGALTVIGATFLRRSRERNK